MAADGPSRHINGDEAIDIVFPGAYVRRNSLTVSNADAYEAALASAEDESAMQRFLEACPAMLVQHLSAGRGAWVVSQKHLGAEHVTDFLIAERNYGNFEWYAVELERPQARMFTRKGDPSAALMHAVRQIDDWRNWLSRNRDYASRQREQSGLGLVNIDPRLEGLIIIGRESEIDQRTYPLRKSLIHDNRVNIQSYDWLLDLAHQHLVAMEEEAARKAAQRAATDELTTEFFTALLSRSFPDRTTKRAVEDVFGGTWSGSADAGLVRGEVDWEGVELWPGSGPGDEVIAQLLIIYAPDNQRGSSLRPDDWEEWIEHVTSNLNACYSLLVTEIAPDERLQERLTSAGDGVWSICEWSQWPRGAPLRLSRLDVLVYLPSASGYAQKRERISLARGVFERNKAVDRERELEEEKYRQERDKEAQNKLDALSLVEGDLVTHDSYGPGIVLSMSGSGADAQAIVEFDSAIGKKHLLLAYAPLRKPRCSSISHCRVGCL
jgi:hypothetical protein